MTKEDLKYTYMESPVGDLLMAGEGDTLHVLSFPKGHKAVTPKPSWRRDDSLFKDIKAQLKAYFAGELQSFDLAMQLDGTDFQKSVWRALQTIPYGETRSYGWLATTIGNVNASRAVGAANGNNPIPIIIPCHRVIGSNGALTGFGGGIDVKKFLLALEGVDVAVEEQLSLL